MTSQLRPSDRVLVAILNNWLDLATAQEKRWYRIPIASADKWLKGRWPPQWLAFYQTKLFGPDAFQVNYFARVIHCETKRRYELFPDEPRDGKGQRLYYQLHLSQVHRLDVPIVSRCWRRIVFIPTTGAKFTAAAEINDLYDESPLEDLLWTQFKRLRIAAERQEFVPVGEASRQAARSASRGRLGFDPTGGFYALDFAIYCGSGNVDVETDGDAWHANPEAAAQDRPRDNDLETTGWRVLRFGTHELQERMADYCLPTIVDNVNRLGGVDEGRHTLRKITLDAPDGLQQLTLFDGR